MTYAPDLSPAQQAALDGAIPVPVDWVEITGIRDAQEVLRSSSISTRTHGAVDQMIRGGGVMRLDGPAHSTRRKTLNRLVRRDGHAWFRDKILFPTVDKTIEKLLDGRIRDAEVSVDLIAFGDQVNTVLAGAIVGFDGLDTPAGLARFNEIDARVDPVSRLSSHEILHHDIDESAIAAFKAAWAELHDEFYVPSLSRRIELLRQVEAGDLPEDELPHDLLTLIAAHADPSWSDDPGVGLREAMSAFRPASETPSQALSHTVDYLDRWFAQHPDDQARCTEPEFLLAALNETLRLGISSTMLLRTAVEDVVLSSGVEIRAGQYVVIRTRAVNRDTVFGPDAGEFNPYRPEVEGVYPFGTAFGSGPHMCFGIPLVLGKEGLDGSLVYILRSLYEVGIRPDPTRPPTRRSYARKDMNQYGTYPVLLGGRRVAAARGI